MIRKIMVLFITLIMFLGFTTVVNAEGAPITKKGSVEITLIEGTDNLIEGAEVTLFHIADGIELNNNLAYSLRAELSGCDIPLDDLTDTKLVNKISKCDLENAIKFVGFTDEFGAVKFEELNAGLYYVMQTKSVNGYSDFDSFLVAFPTLEDNEWVYDIKAKPKTDIYKVVDVTIEKKWNSNRGNIPNEVTIELYDDEELIETVVLNKDNNWTITFERLKLSDKYNVKEINIPKDYTVSYSENNYVFTVTNTDILANTGQIFYPIIILFGLGIILIIIGIRMIRNEV